jgi:Family of unknown function (DUF5678)
MTTAQLLSPEHQAMLIDEPEWSFKREFEGGGRLGNFAAQWLSLVGAGAMQLIVRPAASNPPRGTRSREVEWRRRHPDAFRSIEGQWVALEGEQIVAHGTDVDDVISNARQQGIRIPYVFLVERFDHDVINMGL